MDTEALVSHLKKTLSLEARANADAVNGVPRSDSAELTGTESEIVSEVRKEGLTSIDEFNRSIERLEHDLEECAEKRRALEAEFATVHSQKPPRPAGYEQAGRELEQAQAHLNLFMKEHGLHRKARIPESRFWIFSLVIGVAVVEGLVNSFFFAQASDFGLLGGFFQAFFVSGVNVGFSFIGGFLCLRQLFHRSPGRKLLGLIGMAATLGVVLVINMMAAQYRGLLELGEENPEQKVMELTLALDFSGALNSLNSALLVLIGFLCAFFSIWKGFGADDPYPGYGDMHRDVEAAKDALHDLDDETEFLLQEWRSDILEQMVRIRDQLSDLVTSANSGLNRCRAQRTQLQEFSGERLGSIARQLLSFYRDENRKIRASTAPAYFESYPDGKEFELGPIREKAAGNERKVGELEGRVKDFGREVAEVNRTIEKRMSMMRTTE